MTNPLHRSAPGGQPDFFRVLADQAPVMIWMSGHDMGCFYFNRAWLDFRGRTHEQEFGNGWAEGVHPDDLQGCVEHYVGSFEQRRPFAMSYRLRNAQNQYRWILDRGAPHYRADGTFLGYFGGCAETDTGAVVSRNLELGRQLIEMRETARSIAVECGSLFTKASGGLNPSMTILSRELPELDRLRQRHSAARELEQLATDMLHHQAIPNGARVKA